jgi:hypothetical protein
MVDEVITLDPRDPSEEKTGGIAARPGSLDGKVVGLLSNNKPNSELLLRGVIDLLKEKYNVKEVVVANKGSHRVPAPQDMIDDLVTKCDAVVVATAE